MWNTNDQGEREYSGSKQDWAAVARIAQECTAFKEDDEDEMVAEETISCYNCCYRRWTVKSFVCCKKF